MDPALKRISESYYWAHCQLRWDTARMDLRAAHWDLLWSTGMSQFITLYVTPGIYLSLQEFQEKVLDRIPFFRSDRKRPPAQSPDLVPVSCAKWRLIMLKMAGRGSRELSAARMRHKVSPYRQKKRVRLREEEAF